MAYREPTMSREEAESLYSDIKNNVVRALARKTGGVKKTSDQHKPSSKPPAGEAPPPNMKLLGKQDSHIRSFLSLLLVLICARFCALSLSFFGVIDVKEATAVEHMEQRRLVAPQGATEEEIQIYKELDNRRAELEKRRTHLESRFEELDKQERTLVAKLAELRQLTGELKQQRTDKQKVKSGQIEQLANVYVSMKPEEAARLIQELDIVIAMELIRKMPEKRIGQLLSMMEPSTALKITRMLTESS